MSRTTESRPPAAYAALLELPSGQLVAAGSWPHPSEARAAATSLVNGRVPVWMRAVVPLFASVEQALAVCYEDLIR